MRRSAAVPVFAWSCRIKFEPLTSLEYRSGPGAEGFNVAGGAVAEPTVELGLVFELLAARAGDNDKAAGDFRQSGHIAPEFFKLSDGKNILLPVAPPFFYI